MSRFSRGIHDQRVIDAMSNVPRELFVPPEYREHAYEDRPLPIGYGQTISQPFTVAYMLQALSLCGNEKVLDIGTGSGYAAALLAKLAGEVHSVERIPELAEAARARLISIGCGHVHVHTGDGTHGLDAFKPFDAIVVAAGADHLPPAYEAQLSDGGRIVIPIGSASSQRLMRFCKQGSELSSENLGAFIFVPLIAN